MYDRLSLPGHHRWNWVSILAIGTVFTQIWYPLVSGHALYLVTITAVLLFAGAMTLHAKQQFGYRGLYCLLSVAGGGGFSAEFIGVYTGFPFGQYSYTGTLGQQIMNVPVVIPAAWIMMAYPCLQLGRFWGARSLRSDSSQLHDRIRQTVVTIITGAGALTSWDLFLDPQMVAAGHWRFVNTEPALPGVPGIPLTNYAGWFLVSIMMMSLLHWLTPRRVISQGVPAALLTWTWLGSTLGSFTFFQRPAVGLWGGVIMGIFVLPYLLSLLNFQRQSALAQNLMRAKSFAERTTQ
ncbi:MAG: carotenoid biosynthesis protein [Actinomycetota bacterium]